MAVLSASLIFTAAPVSAMAKPEPVPYECPDSNAHVWDKDQCPRLNPGGGFGGSGGRAGCNGIVCRVIGGILDRIPIL